MSPTKYDLTKRYAEEALEVFLRNNKEKASGAEIRDWIKENYSDEFEQLEKSLGPWLTRAAQDPTSRIEREPGKYGYKLGARLSVDPVISVGNAAAAHYSGDEGYSGDEEQSPSQYVQREKKLYEAFSYWLAAKGYNASDVSRKKRGGVWGNPDVAGLKITQTLGGGLDIDIASVEAKITIKQWRKDFFEAVSHKRFADRVYFAFAHPSNDVDQSRIPDLDALKAYGEKFRVGVAILLLPQVQYEILTGGNGDVLLKTGEYEIIEVWPAVFDRTSVVEREAFLQDVLEIKDLKQAIEYGEVKPGDRAED